MPSQEALRFAKIELDRIERQEGPGLPIWANSPANIYDLASLLDAFAARPVVGPTDIFHAECPSCGAKVDVIPHRFRALS